MDGPIDFNFVISSFMLNKQIINKIPNLADARPTWICFLDPWEKNNDGL